MQQLEGEFSSENGISIRTYRECDAKELAEIYYHTIHQINSRDYSKDQLEAWAPKESVEAEGWLEKFKRTQPFVATCNGKVVGFAEFEPDGHIDCFYCHHQFVGKGVGKALMRAIFSKAKEQKIDRVYAEVSITAKPFFEKQGFATVKEQTVLLRNIEFTNYKMERYT